MTPEAWAYIAITAVAGAYLIWWGLQPRKRGDDEMKRYLQDRERRQ